MLANDDQQKRTVQINRRNELYKSKQNKANYKRNQLRYKTNYTTKPDQQRIPMLDNTTSIQNANTVGRLLQYATVLISYDNRS